MNRRPSAAGPVTLDPAAPSLVRITATRPDDAGGAPWPTVIDWWTDNAPTTGPGHVVATLTRIAWDVPCLDERWQITADGVHIGWTDNPWTVIANGWNSDHGPTP